jgi:hypothetical protein
MTVVTHIYHLLELAPLAVETEVQPTLGKLVAT